MNQKLDEVVKFLQAKNAVLSVAEINQICQILTSCKVEEKVEDAPKPE